jgi:hypothetical protein
MTSYDLSLEERLDRLEAGLAQLAERFLGPLGGARGRELSEITSRYQAQVAERAACEASADPHNLRGERRW